MVLLGSKVPKIRQTAAERLYFTTVLLQNRRELRGMWNPGTVSILQQLLCSVSWDHDDISAVKATRAQIIDVLGLNSPARNENVAVVTKRGPPCQGDQRTYQALVNDFARGI
jgi:hypothetical protein